MEKLGKSKGGFAYLKINLNEKTKRRTVWMTEREKDCLPHELESQETKDRNKKYQNIIFISGNQDLFSMTEGLLLHNYHMEQ